MTDDMASPLKQTKGSLPKSNHGHEGNPEYSKATVSFDVSTKTTASRDRADRPDHFKSLMKHRRASVQFVNRELGLLDSADIKSDSMNSDSSSVTDVLDSKEKEDLIKQTEIMKKLVKYSDDIARFTCRAAHRIEVRLPNISYYVPVKSGGQEIRTVYNQSGLFKCIEWWRNANEQEQGKEEKKSSSAVKATLKHVNLVFKPGKMYLVLGPPGSGKTTLLRATAYLLPGQRKKNNGRKAPFTQGHVEYNGLTRNDPGHVLSNAVTYVDQIDRHAPRLTVKETFEFAFNCKSGGTHRPDDMVKCAESDKLIEEFDNKNLRVNLIMESLGISHVADTFVGNADVRGVSGGQRRRVTVGEMLQFNTSVLCADEISTGLDAASTFDIMSNMLRATRLQESIKIISLLQPSPETFSLFDEVVLMMEGHVIYAGAVENVVDHFDSLGYKMPENMAVADFLQMVSTPDGKELFEPEDSSQVPYTAPRFAEAFRNSEAGQAIQRDLEAPYEFDWRENTSSVTCDEEKGFTETYDSSLFLKKQYHNTFLKSCWLNLIRCVTIWRRDIRFLIANAIKNLVMGASVGAVFWQTDSYISIYGVIFQGMLFVMLGAMNNAPAQIPDRVIFYRHKDANFYPTFAYVIGRAVSLVPQSTTDCLIFGSILYWMVGLAPTAANFFIFIAILVAFAFLMAQQLGIFAAIAPTASVLQATSAFFLLLHILFCGFIVSPDIIPRYYSWLYWWNPLAWAYRGLVVNEFTSQKHGKVVGDNGETEGGVALVTMGFKAPNGQPFGKEWVGYSFAYLCPYIVLCTVLIGVGLMLVRVEGDTGSDDDDEHKTSGVSSDEQESNRTEIAVPFTPVDLTFEDICYEVKASKGDEKLKLLNNVNGVFAAGRMCALMGSSGAGKTTLMDVIALRKTSGSVTGEVRLNGFLQEKHSFRRCSGYVEQFDVQSPQLTVRETVSFSAQLRLDNSDPETLDDERKEEFVDQIIDMLELTSIKNNIVGTDAEGGLSFEQKKRLSIAVEVAASPSILFLDEPTSGLDSRAALIVMRSMAKIAATGRTVCATIHQPSSAVFEMFDDLLLLRKGGEVVFFGELGLHSVRMVDYFETRGAAPICYGENPGTWMLTVLGSGPEKESDKESRDWAELYKSSGDHAALRAKLSAAKSAPDKTKEITYDTEYARSFRKRNALMKRRLVKIYWRSPAYNLARITLSMVIAFILGSVFINNRRPEYFTETRLSSIFSTIFIAFIIIGVLAQLSVLPVMLMIRDVFYRHRAAGMLGHGSLALALGVAEKRFICLSSALFTVIFYFSMGLNKSFSKFVAFWGFFTFNLAIYSYFGQAFMCLVRGMATASILCTVFIGINNLFSGLIVRPQYLDGFWSITYWICPGHYVFEGLIASQFWDDERPVEAFEGSPFFQSLKCTVGQSEPCVGQVNEYMNVFFGGRFQHAHLWYGLLALGVFLTASRLLTLWALKQFNYLST